MEYRSISEVARELPVRPRDISDAFYARQLDDSKCLIVGRRRLIPPDYIDEIRRVMGELGKLPGSTIKPRRGKTRKPVRENVA